MDPVLLASLDTAIATFKADADNLVPAQKGVQDAQAALTAAQANVDTAQSNLIAGQTTLQTDFNTVVAAAKALGLTIPT